MQWKVGACSGRPVILRYVKICQRRVLPELESGVDNCAAASTSPRDKTYLQRHMLSR